MSDRVAELEAQVRSLRAAVKDAADTAVQALDRILLMEPVVAAALAWDFNPTEVRVIELRARVDTYVTAIAKRV